jgi:hypothetical protein
MNELITLQTRCCALLGLPHESPDSEILSRVKKLAAEDQHVHEVTERERLIKEIREACNCSVETALFILSEQERERLHPPARF